jgi:hypothetical protein
LLQTGFPVVTCLTGFFLQYIQKLDAFELQCVSQHETYFFLPDQADARNLFAGAMC